jgi:hypothetical protein
MMPDESQFVALVVRVMGRDKATFKIPGDHEMRRSFYQSGARALFSVAALGATGTLLAGVANASVTPPVFNAPGIPQAGFPDFSNSNNVYLVFGQIGGITKSIGGYTAPSGDYILAAAGTGGVFNANSKTQYGIDNDVFAMYAEFNSKGQFLSGGETIFGCSPPGSSCSLFKIQNLYTVSFDKYAVSTSTVGLGFDTVASTASGWAAQFQKTNESLYLYSSALASLDNALKAGKGIPSIFTATVSEFTTVPLPGVAWLLGPGLAGLFAVARRRRGSSPEALAA